MRKVGYETIHTGILMHTHTQTEAHTHARALYLAAWPSTFMHFLDGMFNAMIPSHG